MKQVYGIRKIKKLVGGVLLGTSLLSSFATVSADEVTPQGVSNITASKILSSEQIKALEDCGYEIYKGDSYKSVENADVYLLYQPKDGSSVLVQNDAKPTSVETTKKSVPQTVKEVVKKALPNTGDTTTDIMLGALGLGLLSLVGYVVFKNKKSGALMLVAILTVGATASVGANEVIACEGFQQLLKAKDYDGSGAYEYVGYIVVPKETIKEGAKQETLKASEEAPKGVVKEETPKTETSEVVTTIWVDTDGNVLKDSTKGTHPAGEFENYIFVTSKSDKGITTHYFYKTPDPVVKEVVKEVIKEVPVEKVVEVIKEVEVEKLVEVVKEVPVEKIVEVIKEIEVEVVKEVITEVPVEVIKEVPVEKLVEVEVIKEVVKEVEVEKVVEVVKEVPVEVIKEVEVEKLIEVIKEVPVETIVEVVKEVEVEKLVEVVKEVPVEVLKEVEVEKLVEVIKEVPVEVIKEVPVEVIKEVEVEKLVEVTKEVTVEVPVEVIKEVEVVKEVEVIKEVPVEVEKEVEKVTEISKESVYGSVVIHYVDTTGKTIQADTYDTPFTKVGTYTTTKVTVGGVVESEGTVYESLGVSYDATQGNEKPQTIVTADGTKYELVDYLAASMVDGTPIENGVKQVESVSNGVKHTAQVTGEVIEGITHITYVYDVVTPTAEEPQPEEPKVDEPTQEEPKVEEPQPEETPTTLWVLYDGTVLDFAEGTKEPEGSANVTPYSYQRTEVQGSQTIHYYDLSHEVEIEDEE